MMSTAFIRYGALLCKSRNQQMMLMHRQWSNIAASTSAAGGVAKGIHNGAIGTGNILSGSEKMTIPTVTPAQLSNALQVRTAATAAVAAPHNHGKHWAFERVITVSLIGLIPASFAFYHPSMDYVLALALCLHSHWGLHGICCDYIRPKLFGAALAKMAELIVYALSFAAFGCVMYFNYHDVGLIPAFKMLWKL